MSSPTQNDLKRQNCVITAMALASASSVYKPTFDAFVDCHKKSLKESLELCGVEVKTTVAPEHFAKPGYFYLKNLSTQSTSEAFQALHLAQWAVGVLGDTIYVSFAGTQVRTYAPSGHRFVNPCV